MKQRVACISALPPTRDNLGGPTALPYQLLKYAPDEIDIDLYFFPGSEENKEIVNEDIGHLKVRSVCEIPNVVSKNGFFERLRRRVYRKHSLLPDGVSRFPLNREIVRKVNASNPTIVWLYPHWLIDWVPAIRCSNVVVTGPDSAVLHSERVIRFGKWNDYEEIVPEYERLLRNVELEKRWGKTSARIHMVGQEDVRKYAAVTHRCGQATFIRYPLHRFCETRNSMVHPIVRLRVVISGSAGGKSVYVGDHLVRATRSLAAAADQLRKHFEFLIIGTGYAEIVTQLSECGYSVVQKDWVEDYATEIADGHIQFFPIAVGTGTKGKVVSALATGLLGIGTKFAYENILIDVPGDALIYDRPEDIVRILESVQDNRKQFDNVRQQTAAKVRGSHAPEIVGVDFWKWAFDG
jgi:hypothetical protein